MNKDFKTLQECLDYLDSTYENGKDKTYDVNKSVICGYAIEDMLLSKKDIDDLRRMDRGESAEEITKENLALWKKERGEK